LQCSRILYSVSILGCSTRNMSKCHFSGQGVGIGTDLPAENSRKIPNLVSRHRAKEVSVAWGLQPFERGNPGTNQCYKGNLRSQEYPERYIWLSDIGWLKRLVHAQKMRASTNICRKIRNRKLFAGEKTVEERPSLILMPMKAVLSFKGEVSASSRVGTRVR
jgi:hypothetical protein